MTDQTRQGADQVMIIMALIWHIFYTRNLQTMSNKFRLKRIKTWSSVGFNPSFQLTLFYDYMPTNCSNSIHQNSRRQLNYAFIDIVGLKFVRTLTQLFEGRTFPGKC